MNDITRAELKCPICSTPLTPVQFKGVPIDACEEHGVWLDNGELEKILQNRERSLKVKNRRKTHQANREGKISGAMFGWFSLFFDR